MELRDKNGLTEAEFLAAYKPGDYERPSMTVDMLVFAAPGLTRTPALHFLNDGSLKLLMIQRGGHPCLGMYALPGGFVNSSETVMEAARRELWEETKAENVPLTQLYTFSQPGRDPRTWVMSCAHIAVLNTDRIPVEAGDDADNAEWFSVTLTHHKLDSNDDKDQNNSLGNWNYQLSLHGSRTLSATLNCPKDFDESSCQLIENDGFAFDHAQMILCGLKKLFHI